MCKSRANGRAEKALCHKAFSGVGREFSSSLQDKNSGGLKQRKKHLIFSEYHQIQVLFAAQNCAKCGGGCGIRTHVPRGQTVFKTFEQLPKSSRIIPKPPQFSARFSLFLAPSRKFARKLRESCEKPLKTT